jgi:kynurenine formamidase
MRNLDQVPAVGSLIVCAFPKLKDGVGFPARCFAICPAD